MKMRARFIQVLVAVVIVGFVIATCTTGVTTRSYLATQNPGDVWTWSLNSDSTFSATNEETGYTYSGDLDTLSSGFLKFTIQSTTDPGATVGDIAYGFEVPDTALVIKPAGSTDAIFGVAQGPCPSTGTIHANSIDIPRPGWTYSVDHAYSTVTAIITGSTLEVSSDKYNLDGSLNSHEDSTGLTCADGRVTNPSSPSVATMTPNGGYLVDSGSGNGGNFGMQAPVSDIVISDVLASGREYRGILYKDINTPSESTELIWARPNGSGGLAGGQYTDIEAGTEDTVNAANIIFNTQPVPGIYRASKTDGSGTTDILFVINRLSSKYMMFGISIDPGTSQPQVFIAMER